MPQFYRFLLAFVAFLLLASAAFAQGMENPVKWTASAEKTGEGAYTLIFRASIGDTYKSYSMFTDPAGAYPTELKYKNEADFELIGKAEETTSAPANRKEGADPLFDGAVVISYKHDFEIRQKIKLKNAATTAISGYVTSMACDAESCLPPTDTDFAIDLATGGSTDVKIDTSKLAKGSEGGIEIERKRSLETLAALEKEGAAGSCGVESDAMGTSGLSWLRIFIFGFLGGLLALLTPCVFPMVPLTVSYFTKRSTSRVAGIRNALIYSLSIIVIYVALGLLVTVAVGPSALNVLSTHWIPNTIFFVLFVVFAFSFFGYYEITLPSSWSTKTDAQADKGGLIGIFFMAFTLALVSFSCTGPIIGTLLVEAANGGVIAPVIGMTGFSLALALPFGLFALFPTALNALPKGGGWMTTMKVVLGFIELALAFKFLSKADLTEHWGILKYETYLIVTLLCSAGMGIYLLGLIKFPHDDHQWGRSTVAGYIGAALSFGLTAYIAMGFSYSERTKTFHTPDLLAGIVPPACYSYTYPCDCPAGIRSCYKDYYEGMEYARKVGKPVLLDFTGHACENCRKMENSVWSEAKINQLINDEYVLISLYVDDRKALPQERLAADGKTVLRTVGNLWTEFEKVNYKSQAQPLYVLLAPDETVLHLPIGATLEAGGVEKYEKFLQCGISKMKQK